MKRFPTLLSLIAFAVLVGAMSASATDSSDSSGASDDAIKTYDHEYRLTNSRTEVIVGVGNPDGTCTFAYPVLSLEPDESAVEARPVQIDFEKCVQTVEIGTPPASSLDEESEGVLATEEFKTIGRSGTLDGQRASTSGDGVTLAASGSATVYYEVRWEDLVHIDTTRTRAYLTWSWNGSCVTSSSAWGSYWYFTGWSLVSSSGYKTSSCNNHTSVVDSAHYNGPTVCDPDTWVDDAWSRGYYDGRVNGGLGSTWTSPSCTLHYHTVLVKY